MADASSTAGALRMLAGALIWALHFTTIYGFTALACARGFASLQWFGIGVVGWVVGGATVIALLAAAWIMVAAIRTRPAAGFVGWMTAGVAALAIPAIVWETLAAMMLPGCA